MKSNYVRIILLAILVLLGSSIYTKWKQEHAPEPAKAQTTAEQHANNNTRSVATPSPSPEKQAPTPDKQTETSGSHQSHSTDQPPIHVQTDVYDLTISPRNGEITNTRLRQYNTSLKNKSPLTLLSNNPDKLYIVKNGFSSKQLGNKPVIYSASKRNYKLGNNDQLTVTLKARVNDLTLIKKYVFHKGSYTIKIDQTVHNNTGETISGYFYGNIIRKHNPVSGGLFDVHSYATYRGTILSSKQDHFRKAPYSDIKEAPDNTIKVQTDQGWAAMAQHYFISAWIPSTTTGKSENTLFSTTNGADNYATGAFSPLKTLKPGDQITDQNKLYIGPTLKDQLMNAAPYLDKTIDYGMLWFISEFIFWAMMLIYSVVGNWGLAIILVTCLIKLVFYPLSSKSYRSMGKMRLLQPRIQQIKERYGDDKQGMTKAMMSLYKTEKVNPLGGCLPLLVQIPVFIALYWVLLESVQLRQAPFIFWIQDLATKDPYYVLPVLMGLSMFVQQRLNPAPPDPTQAKIMMFMPVVFTLMFLNFPSGLVLYWLVNNVLSIIQQWYVMRKIEKENRYRQG